MWKGELDGAGRTDLDGGHSVWRCFRGPEGDTDTVTPASFLFSQQQEDRESQRKRVGGEAPGPSVTCIGKARKRLIRVVMVCFVLEEILDFEEARSGGESLDCIECWKTGFTLSLWETRKPKSW